MQTIKTAAVVVLMLTVLYGGYVSLTTPPEPISPEVQQFLDIDESLSSDFSPSSDLAEEFGLDQGFGGPDVQTARDAVAPEPPASAVATGYGTGVPSMNAVATETTPQAEPLQGVPRATLPATTAAASAPAVPGGFRSTNTPSMDLGQLQAQLNATQPSAGRAAPVLPPAGGASGQLGTDADPSAVTGYTSTGKTFVVPDPKADANQLGPRGTANAATLQGNPSTAQSNGRPSGALASAELGAGSPVDRQPGNQAAPNADEIKQRSLIRAMETCDRYYQKGQLKEALALLSMFYSKPNLDPELRAQMLSRLDPLARDVIYSKRHLLAQPHRVRGGETMMDIAREYQVPWQLLANINGVEDPVTVLPGTELKVIQGPFRAEVNLTTKQLTLFLDDLYAGRFPVEVGNDPQPAPGTFTVLDKRSDRVYYTAQGTAVPANDPSNPYGKMWLDLGGRICIHGSPNAVQPTDKGCISVAGDYADDVHGILGQGSSVVIIR